MAINKTKQSLNGNEAIKMAAHMIDELDGINNLRVSEWIEYSDVDFMDKCAKPQRKTLLHEYIEFIYYFQNEYTLDKHFPMAVINSLVELLDLYQIDYSKIGQFDKVGYEEDELESDEFEKAEKYAKELLQFFEKELGTVIVDDIFTVLFANKHFLFEFNSQVMELVEELTLANHPDYLKKDGVIKRCTYIPQWLKTGVFMRDKGRCQICGTDLTKLLHIDNQENYDHIIPLENGGTNDPTNFQLTCERCNKSKGARSMDFNSFGSRFWVLESDS